MDSEEKKELSLSELQEDLAEVTRLIRRKMKSEEDITNLIEYRKQLEHDIDRFQSPPSTQASNALVQGDSTMILKRLDEQKISLDEQKKMLSSLYSDRKSIKGVLSGVKTLDYQIIERGFQIEPFIQKTAMSLEHEDFKRFAWAKKNEVDNKQDYLTFIQNEFKLPESHFFEHAPVGLLSYARSTLSLAGTADVVTFLAGNDTLSPGSMRIIIELKTPDQMKKKRSSNVQQAQLELLCAEAKSTHPILVLLTDLQEIWELFWFSTPKQPVHRLVTPKVVQNAITNFIDLSLISFTEEDIPKPYEKAQRIHFLPAISEQDDNDDNVNTAIIVDNMRDLTVADTPEEENECITKIARASLADSNGSISSDSDS